MVVEIFTDQGEGVKEHIDALGFELQLLVICQSLSTVVIVFTVEFFRVVSLVTVSTSSLASFGRSSIVLSRLSVIIAAAITLFLLRIFLLILCVRFDVFVEIGHAVIEFLNDRSYSFTFIEVILHHFLEPLIHNQEHQ